MNSQPPTEERTLRPLPRGVLPAAGLAVAVGAAAFVVQLLADPAAAWRGLLVNFLFWMCLAQGAVVWAVMFRIARTSWSAPVMRVARAFMGFLPFGIAVFAVMYLGRGDLLPWLHFSVGDERWWLNAPFLWIRDGASLVIVWVLSLLFVRTYPAR